MCALGLHFTDSSTDKMPIRHGYRLPSQREFWWSLSLCQFAHLFVFGPTDSYIRKNWWKLIFMPSCVLFRSWLIWHSKTDGARTQIRSGQPLTAHTSSPSFTKPSVDLNIFTALMCSTAISSPAIFSSTQTASSKFATLDLLEGVHFSRLNMRFRDQIGRVSDRSDLGSVTSKRNSYEAGRWASFQRCSVHLADLVPSSGAMLNCTLHPCPSKCHQLFDHSKVLFQQMLFGKCAAGVHTI
jgi:hypothetical protein